jgi:hypothetical protein
MTANSTREEAEAEVISAIAALREAVNKLTDDDDDVQNDGVGMLQDLLTRINAFLKYSETVVLRATAVTSTFIDMLKLYLVMHEGDGASTNPRLFLASLRASIHAAFLDESSTAKCDFPVEGKRCQTKVPHKDYICRCHSMACRNPESNLTKEEEEIFTTHEEHKKNVHNNSNLSPEQKRQV